jgi:predicted RNA binding protein YcfA (HicA-like mRNA interferase family)
MTKLPSVSSDALVRALQKAGFTYAPKRGKGSHVALYRIDETGRKRLVIVPKKKDIPRGTLNTVLQQAGLSPQEFLRFL